MNAASSLDPRLQSIIDDLSPRATPLEVIQVLATAWGNDTTMHRALPEAALLSQIVSALRASGIEVVTEPRGWKGHADIAIEADHRNAPRHILHQGRGLVANALLWHTPSEFRESLDRLLPQVTKFDRQAAIIVFVRKGSLEQAMQLARLVCEKHPAFGNFGKAVADNQTKLWLSVSKNPDKIIPTTLLFFDLFERPPTGDVGDPGTADAWEPYGGMFRPE